MQLCDLQETKLALEPAAIADAFAPFELKWPSPDHPAWRLLMAAEHGALAVASAGQALFGGLPILQRSPEFVARYYGRKQRSVDYAKYDPALARGRPRQWEWRGRKMVGRNLGGTRVRLLLLMRLIERLCPANVLEVGCGDAINLFLLACRFPEIKFSGLDLSEQRYRAAVELQRLAQLPRSLAQYSPLPTTDATAFRRVDLHQGSAARMPFATGQFELVITVVALEQMERIRDEVLREIARVASNRVALIEPFADVNERGPSRNYILARDYFRGHIDELSSYGLEPEFATADFPQKTLLRVALVQSQKRNWNSKSALGSKVVPPTVDVGFAPLPR